MLRVDPGGAARVQASIVIHATRSAPTARAATCGLSLVGKLCRQDLAAVTSLGELHERCPVCPSPISRLRARAQPCVRRSASLRAPGAPCSAAAAVLDDDLTLTSAESLLSLLFSHYSSALISQHSTVNSPICVHDLTSVFVFARGVRM